MYPHFPLPEYPLLVFPYPEYPLKVFPDAKEPCQVFPHTALRLSVHLFWKVLQKLHNPILLFCHLLHGF